MGVGVNEEGWRGMRMGEDDDDIGRDYDDIDER